MTREEINLKLRKSLKPNGNRFDSFFPLVDCEVYANGFGSPKYILDFMKEVVNTHYEQVYTLANKLKKNNLKDTITSFYHFPYDYIQYDVDGYRQNVLSPACAWKNRLVGMDCKSFTVFTAALCKAVNIKSYMRQIKQGDDRVSHVYLVVPVDQVTGSLETKGHYVIDATTKDNKEVYFSWKNDLSMDLPVVGMNGHNTQLQTGKTDCNCEKDLSIQYQTEFNSGATIGMGNYAAIIGQIDVGAFTNPNSSTGSQQMASTLIQGGFAAAGAAVGGPIGLAIGSLVANITVSLLGEALNDFDFSCTNSWYDPIDFTEDLTSLTNWYKIQGDTLAGHVSSGKHLNAASVFTDIIGVLSIVELSLPIKAGEARSNCTKTRLNDLKKATASLKVSLLDVLNNELSVIYNIKSLGFKSFKTNDYSGWLLPMYLGTNPDYDQEIYVFEPKKSGVSELFTSGFGQSSVFIAGLAALGLIIGGTKYLKNKKI
jgi:hypothetical protein